MNKEIIEGRYSFNRFFRITFLQGLIFVLFAVLVFGERNTTAICFILFIALVLFPIIVSAIFPIITYFSVHQDGVDIRIIGIGRFLRWEDIKSASSQLGQLHITFSRCGILEVPSPYFMKNRNEIYRAIDEYAPNDSPIRNIIKKYDKTPEGNPVPPSS